MLIAHEYRACKTLLCIVRERFSDMSAVEPAGVLLPLILQCQLEDIMDHYTTIADLRKRLASDRASGRRVGWVGTSGALHEGHQALLRRSVAENDVTFMYWGGAGRFGWMNGERTYERDLQRDLEVALSAGLDALFVPSNEDLFPRPPMTKVSLPEMSSEVAGLEDPAHLDLIAMVMAKLFNIFGESRSYSGEKDWQQMVMFKRLAEDLEFPVEVVGCPTVRHEDGLAVSSRNSKLTAAQREKAPVLYQALCAAAGAIEEGERSQAELHKMVKGRVEEVGTLEYFVAVEPSTMALVDPIVGDTRLLASMGLGDVRLVDNCGASIRP
jgi:pantoate--beta-alanine ligase